MTLWRRTIPLIGWVSLLVLLGTVACIGLTTIFLLDRIAEHLSAVLAEVRSEGFRDRCAAAPEGWTTWLDNGDELRTFDLARLPPPPEGPDPRALAEILAGADNAIRPIFFEAYGGLALMRLAPSGPCSLVQIRWMHSRPERVATGATMLLMALLAALLIGLCIALVVVRPVIRRVQRIRAAAARVGEGDGYRSAADAAGDEIGRLSTALDRANDRIASTTRQLREQNEALLLHLADIAHDLKTPLTGIQLTLEQAAHADDPAELQSLIPTCLEDCVYLAAMIDNLRVGTMLKDGLEPAAEEARVDLGEVVARVVRRLGLLSRYKGIELDMALPDDPVLCACRPLVLERVVDNLLYNSVSHGREGGHVAVLLEATAGRFRLTVLDDGPGMRPEELETIGKRWFRGAGADLHAPRGSGLGLRIVSEVCRRWNWDLRFEPNRPKGLKVTLSGSLAA